MKIEAVVIVPRLTNSSSSTSISHPRSKGPEWFTADSISGVPSYLLNAGKRIGGSSSSSSSSSAIANKQSSESTLSLNPLTIEHKPFSLTSFAMALKKDIQTNRQNMTKISAPPKKVELLEKLPTLQQEFFNACFSCDISELIRTRLVEPELVTNSRHPSHGGTGLHVVAGLTLIKSCNVKFINSIIYSS